MTELEFHEDRRENDALWRETFKRRLDAFEEKLEKNSNLTAEIRKDTAELVEMLKAWQGTAKVFGWVSKPVVRLVAFIGAAAGVYTAWPKR
jgi:hypothetical protein